MIGIINFGYGNIQSIINALNDAEIKSKVENKTEIIDLISFIISSLIIIIIPDIKHRFIFSVNNDYVNVKYFIISKFF